MFYVPLPVPSGGGRGLPGQVLAAGERDGSESGAELDQTGQDRQREGRRRDAAGHGGQSAAAAAAAGARGRRHLGQHRRLLLRIPARPQTGEARSFTRTNRSPRVQEDGKDSQGQENMSGSVRKCQVCLHSSVYLP